MFKVGQTVWCVLRWKGCVKEVRHDGTVLVVFTNGATSTFNSDGSWGPDKRRALYFSEPIITGSLNPPFEPSLSKGDLVVVCSNLQSDNSTLFTRIVDEELEDRIISNGLVYFKDTFKFYRIGEEIK